MGTPGHTNFKFKYDPDTQAHDSKGCTSLLSDDVSTRSVDDSFDTPRTDAP